MAVLGLCVLPSLAACSGSEAAASSSAKAVSKPGTEATASALAPPLATSAPLSTSAPMASGEAVVAPNVAAPSLAQLKAALPARPAGATPWPASYGPEGVLTAAQYVAAAGPDNASELALQQRRGLQSGANWTWNAPDGVQVEILLARYTTDVGAQSYYLSERTGLLKEYSGVTPFQLPGEPESWGLPIATLDSFGDAVVRTNALAGDTVIIVNVNNPATPDTADANAVSSRIYRALCAAQGGCSVQ